jgi:hypothetical protein
MAAARYTTSSNSKLLLHQDSLPYPVLGVAIVGAVHSGSAQQDEAIAGFSASALQRIISSTPHAPVSVGPLLHQTDPAEASSLPVKLDLRRTDIAMDDEYIRLCRELDEKKTAAWDMRGEVMDARVTNNAELPYLCQVECAAMEAAMKVQAGMNGLELDVVQQRRPRSPVQERKYQKLGKSLNSAKKTEKEMQRRKLELADQMQEVERRLFDTFMDMQQLDHRIRPLISVSPDPLHVSLTNPIDESATSILASLSESNSRLTALEALPDVSTIDRRAKVEDEEEKPVDEEEHGQATSEAQENVLTIDTQPQVDDEEGIKHVESEPSVVLGDDRDDISVKPHPDSAAEGGSISKEVVQPSESSWSDDTAVSVSVAR